MAKNSKSKKLFISFLKAFLYARSCLVTSRRDFSDHFSWLCSANLKYKANVDIHRKGSLTCYK